ncbi:MAG: 16S rRNA (guanine(966)-N(2))-methyltransferase RsmD [Bacteroidales bacterium]|nr:16S rRNA (guanine(966)-N(2))-methyltransferase RsmD [Bacteroidales bacterium]
MRIIAGTLRGRRLNPPANLPVRPTTDMARESLFNILNNYVDYEQCQVMDMFSGTGAVAVEFISRGASSVTVVDINSQCTDYIRSECQRLNIGNLQVVRADVFDLIKRLSSNKMGMSTGFGTKYDIIFADPPYAMTELASLPDLVFDGNLLSDDGIFILEHPREFDFESHAHFWQHRAYGKVNFSFFANKFDQ